MLAEPLLASLGFRATRTRKDGGPCVTAALRTNCESAALVSTDPDGVPG